ncbi:hypothetical protein KQI61_04425 [Anaerocolumna aminovalerica]|uniref:hypothetical protein n=1 Tax=Anaerocolumna aminovalerica TaxID=1527 RepID=UPI001C0F05E3|nr:hypothetical protein [Anaerocolumna aminovalerica]MBU5331433.1 hypothetical protein [Anaerocolumna aminovalerica]
MERLTEFRDGIWGMSKQAIEDGHDRYSVFSRLAAYENTGFTSDDIEDIKAILDTEGDGKSGEETLMYLLELIQYRKTGLTPIVIEQLKSDHDHWKRESISDKSKLGLLRLWFGNKGMDMDNALEEISKQVK